MSIPFPDLRPPLLRALPALALAASAALLAPRPAAAQGTSEQRAACTSDAMRLCLSALPDVGRITSCMKAHYGELSPRCQASFNEESHAAPSRKQAEEATQPRPGGAEEGPRKSELRQAEPRQAEAKPVEGKPVEGKRVEAKPPEAKRAPRRVEARRAEERHPEVAAVEAQREAPRRERAAMRTAQPRDLGARDVVREPPLRGAPAEVPPPAAAGRRVLAEGPVPEAAGSFATSNSSLAKACRFGLIDAYTCANTIPALGLDH